MYMIQVQVVQHSHSTSRAAIYLHVKKVGYLSHQHCTVYKCHIIVCRQFLQQLYSQLTILQIIQTRSTFVNLSFHPLGCGSSSNLSDHTHFSQSTPPKLVLLLHLAWWHWWSWLSVPLYCCSTRSTLSIFFISLDGIDEVGCLWYHFTSVVPLPGPLLSPWAVLQIWLLGVRAACAFSCNTNSCILIIIGAGP